MAAHAHQRPPVVAANARRSPSYGCALRLNRAPLAGLLATPNCLSPSTLKKGTPRTALVYTEVTRTELVSVGSRSAVWSARWFGLAVQFMLIVVMLCVAHEPFVTVAGHLIAMEPRESVPAEHPRRGKRVTMWEEAVSIEGIGRPVRRVLRLIERTIDGRGQHLIPWLIRPRAQPPATSQRGHEHAAD